MNVKTIVTIALIGLLGVGTAAGIFLSDRSQQQEPPSADIQQEEKEEAPVESSSQKEEQEQSSQETKQQQLAEEFAKEKEEYYLLLANAENPLPQDWSIQTEEVQNGYEMDKRAAPAMREMIQAAKEDGVELMLCSAYRSVEKQQQLFDRSQQAYMAQGMSEEDAYAKTATETAIPGTSEHQTGLAADIVTPTYQMLDAGFADTPAGQWLSEHAAEYGFVLRYPQDKQEVTGIIYESWHYRFVGKTHAKLMKESGLCLEEYLQQELPEGYTGASDPYDLPKQP
ncbi:MAG: M15 family metallopeptidase [Clostridium sp.]|nr:M15 family metallopeptidase [Clostridium sp.]